MSLYVDSKIWVVDSVCAALNPVAPKLFNTFCGRFFDGFFITAELLTISTLIGLPLALLLALARSSDSPTLSGFSYAYSYVFRGTPLLVQLSIFYYGFGELGAERLGFLWLLFRDAYAVSVMVMTINTSAYAAEIFRGGIDNVPNGQREAAVAAGMGWWTTQRRIVLPQALRIAWPAYSNEVLLLLKGSALVSTITVLDLMGQTRTIFARNFELEIFVYAIILYLTLSVVLTGVLRWIEFRMRLPGY